MEIPKSTDVFPLSEWEFYTAPFKKLHPPNTRERPISAARITPPPPSQYRITAMGPVGKTSAAYVAIKFEPRFPRHTRSQLPHRTYKQNNFQNNCHLQNVINKLPTTESKHVHEDGCTVRPWAAVPWDEGENFAPSTLRLFQKYQRKRLLCSSP
jgi:hypothetical protein